MKSNINQALIASYNGIEVPKTIEVSKENIYIAYSGEREAYQEIKDANEKAKSELSTVPQEIKPKLFNYHAIGSSGTEMERTDIITATQDINMTTYYRNNETWASLKINELSPEGIYEMDLFFPSSRYGEPENVSVSIKFYPNERLSENGIDVSNYHPFQKYGKNIVATKLISTKMDYMSKEQIEQFVGQITHADIKTFCQQLQLQEQERKRQEELRQQEEQMGTPMTM